MLSGSRGNSLTGCGHSGYSQQLEGEGLLLLCNKVPQTQGCSTAQLSDLTVFAGLNQGATRLRVSWIRAMALSQGSASSSKLPGSQQNSILAAIGPGSPFSF